MSSAVEPHTTGTRYPFSRGHDRSCETGHSSHTHTDAQAANSWFEGGLPTPPRSKDMTGLSIAQNATNYAFSNSYTNGFRGSHTSSQHSRVPSDPHGTGFAVRSNVQDSKASQQSKNDGIASYLQIPESINSSKGSITEFAAEITCLFWFESAATLDYAENLPADALPDRGLVPDASPTLGFRKWVAAILSTTQVGKNVILLALMFIYRLKKFNPSVSGKRGSEFRLLTIALMLGNKFLDDNTYTNKTWAEVSGISVQEIHIMEVEFLSNMRYQLYASQAEWSRWKALLGKFDSFYDKASRHITRASPNQSQLITPLAQTPNYKLPSPPSKHFMPGAQNQSSVPNPMTTLPQLPRSPIRHQQSQSAIPFERKRSLDTSDSLPPAKRLYHAPGSAAFPIASLPPHLVTNTASAGSSPFTAETLLGPGIPQLPMPRIPTTNPSIGTNLTPLSLPPSRAMASVYPAVSTSWTQPITPISSLPPTIAGQFQPSQTSFAETIRPMNGISSGQTSPVNMYGPGTPSRQLSPSYFLTNRSSPYRPVRNVHTLLIPPPSAAMQNAARNIDFDQMHYQPLGRPVSDRRSGPVPYMALQHSAVSTPNTAQYRNF